MTSELNHAQCVILLSISFLSYFLPTYMYLSVRLENLGRYQQVNPYRNQYEYGLHHSMRKEVAFEIF